MHYSTQSPTLQHPPRTTTVLVVALAAILPRGGVPLTLCVRTGPGCKSRARRCTFSHSNVIGRTSPWPHWRVIHTMRTTMRTFLSALTLMTSAQFCPNFQVSYCGYTKGVGLNPSDCNTFQNTNSVTIRCQDKDLNECEEGPSCTLAPPPPPSPSPPLRLLRREAPPAIRPRAR